MTDRIKAREALRKLDEELEPLMRRRAQLMDELRERLYHDAYEARRRTERTGRDSCSRCERKFEPGMEVRELVDDNGVVQRRYHYPDCQHPWQGSRESREAGQRRGKY